SKDCLHILLAYFPPYCPKFCTQASACAQNFGQSDEKSVGAICTNDLISAYLVTVKGINPRRVKK
ncbi:MAG: hypothetical protein ACI4HN_08825, partial [Ruminococcus sp.]